MIDRREALISMAGAVAVATSSPAAVAAPPEKTAPSAQPLIGMIAYPGMFPLDLIGPEAVFSALGTHQVRLLWKTLDPVRSQSGLAILPTMTLADAPVLDILFVPGGAIGSAVLMDDAEILGFLIDRAPHASWVTSVCTGSLILASAGLLCGYRATSHWAVRDRLRDLGAIPVHARVVEDRNRMTGAGVSAGLDMALTLAKRIAGVDRAKAAQLNIEYDPLPPLHAGTPEGAGPGITDALTKAYQPFLDSVGVAIPRARARLGLS